MNYNRFSKIPKENKPQCSRAKLDTGTECNFNCYFCYYQGHLDESDTYEEIIERAQKLKDLGILEIDLSGGESSIHKDWFKILEYCNKNFNTVSCLSNGGMFANYDFLKKSKDHGLSEILFSLHGYDEKSHDKIVGVKGAYQNILKAIENAKSLDIMVRINCTVTSNNVNHLDIYTSIINKIKPFQLNYLPLNYWDSAQTLRTQNYEKLSDKIKKSIDTLDKDIEINVRYIPFCFMRGYEKYVKDIPQHIYDLRDWNIASYCYKPLDEIFDIAYKNRLETYYKPRECFKCKYFNECDGIEKQYKTISKEILKPYD
jgi:MoaA/NifB/PqqE/SkfB family radical SAM enzyme